MSEKPDKIKIKIDSQNFGQFKINDTERRMKLYVKLNQNETQQWKALRDALTGGNVSHDELARVMFLRGVMAFTNELNERIESMSEEDKQALLDEAGVTVPEVEVEVPTNENSKES